VATLHNNYKKNSHKMFQKVHISKGKQVFQQFARQHNPGTVNRIMRGKGFQFLQNLRGLV
jgi:hypothetical protein